jgi:hypothetical protein
MPLRRAIVLAVGVVLTLAPLASAAEPGVEDRIVSMINSERTDPLIVHYGLLAAARGHSHEMALRGGMDHDGADERVNNAPPDPAEANGAPDDGFATAAWCENVTYSVGTSEEDASQRIYDAWHRSGAHHRCMMDTTRNVGAVGVYYDGQSWWATFIAEDDSTPPGGAPAPKAATKAPKPTSRPAEPAETPADATPEAEPASSVSAPSPSPVGLVSETSAPDDDAEPVASADTEPDPATAAPPSEPARLRTRADVPAIASTAAEPVSAPVLDFGWQEFVAVIAVLALGTYILRGALVPTLRPPPRPPDVPVVDRELVGAGSGQR